MKVNKYIFEVGDMNKQKLLEVEREKKGEKWNLGLFLDKRGERKQIKKYVREGVERELMNVGILIFYCSRSSRFGRGFFD